MMMVQIWNLTEKSVNILTDLKLRKSYNFYQS